MSLRYIQAIFIAARAGAAMIRLPEVLATAGLGLDGDRYANHAGYYSPHDDVCEVTLIEGEVLDRIEAIDGLRVQHGEHRRNIVTRGLILRELQGRCLRVGEVLRQAAATMRLYRTNH